MHTWPPPGAAAAARARSATSRCHAVSGGFGGAVAGWSSAIQPR
jgi:hypothetical protein